MSEGVPRYLQSGSQTRVALNIESLGEDFCMFVYFLDEGREVER